MRTWIERLFLRRPLVALVAVLLFGSVLAIPCHADQADDDYLVARTHYQKKRWKDASESFQTYLRKHGKHRFVPFARFYLGVSLENQEEYRKARTVLRGFAKDYPKNRIRPDALFRIGECSYFLNDLKAAEKELAAFLKENPKHDFAEFALPYLGDAQYRLNKPPTAAKTFLKSLGQNPDGRMADDSRFGLAHCYAALKQPEKAIKLYRELAGKPASHLAAESQLALGTLLFELKRDKEAAAAFDAFETSFAKHAKLPRARMNAGYAYYRLQDYKTAADRFQKAAAAKPLRTEANYWRALSHKQSADYETAVALLKTEFNALVPKLKLGNEHKLAPVILFEWATCERFRDRTQEARQRYLEFVKRWPQHDDADDALYFAAEMALQLGDTKEAQQLVDRFRKDYAKSDIWPYRDLLQARIYTAGTDDKQHKQAETLLRGILAKSTNTRSKRLARFHLLRTLRLRGDHQAVLADSKPLLEDVRKKGEKSEFVDALLLVGRSQLAEKNYKDAVATTTDYLKLRTEGELVPTALATRATAAFHAGATKQLLADADRLLSDFSKVPAAAQTVHQLAETAYRKSDWKTAAALFSKLAELGVESKYHGPALSGLGWTQFEAKDYEKASATFGKLLKEHPDDLVLASQAAYKQAECAEQLKKPEDAARKYLAAFERFAPKSPAKAGSEKQGKKYYYTFRNGLRAARLYAKLKGKTEQADAVYEKLFKAFPQPESFDKYLDEWALVNYNANRYKRADEIFRRLVKETPNSPLVDNARYTLAESDLNAGNLDAAKKQFLALHSGEKSDATVKEVSLYRLIGIGIEQEDWKNAQSWAAKFRTQFPKSEHRWSAAFSEAEAKFHQGDYRGAETLLAELRKRKADSAAAKSPWFPRVWLVSGAAANELKNYDLTERLIAEAKRRFPRWEQAYLLDEVLGVCFKQQAKFKQARAAFERVTSHKVGGKTETAAKCQFLIGDTYLLQDDYKSARKAYFRVDALYAFPRWQATALYYAGLCEEKLEDFAAAVKTYQELIRRFPKSSYAAKAKPRLAAARKRAGQTGDR